MAKILSINGYGDEKQGKENVLKNLWWWFTSLDRFLKTTFAIVLLIVIVTPVIISEYIQTRQYASQSELIMFLNSSGDTPITQTTTQDIRLRLTPPTNWTLTKADFFAHAYAQTISPTVESTPTSLPTPTVLPTITETPSPLPSATILPSLSPTITPLLTVTPSTAPILDTPVATATPAASVLTEIHIYNSDDGPKNGAPPLVIKKADIITAFSQPIPWKLNALAVGEVSGTRTVTVEFVDENNTKTTAIASIVMTLPILPTTIPTLTVTPTVISPTVTITITPTLLPTNTVETPSATPTNSPTITLSPVPTKPVTSHGPPTVPGQIIVKYKDGQSPEELTANVVRREVSKQTITGAVLNTLENTKNVMTGQQQPEEALAQIINTNNTYQINTDKSLISKNHPYKKGEETLANIHILKTEQPTSSSTLQQAYKALSSVEYAVPNYIVKSGDAPPPTITPNDPIFVYQWYLTKIKAPEAWGISEGSPNTIVAVIDGALGGGEYDENRLVGKFQNSDGVHFKNGDGQYYPLPNIEGHGTHVASIIGAITNNSQNTSGANWNTKMMLVDIASSYSGYWGWSGNFYDIAEGVQWAVTNGANVINMSIQTDPSSNLTCNAFLQSMIAYALANNVTVVTSAGNYGVSAQTSVPGNCPGVIDVGATNTRDQIAQWWWNGNGGDCGGNCGGSAGNGEVGSNTGTPISLSAPGGGDPSDPSGIQWTNGIVSTPDYQNSGYGTSFAAPQVAAAASLMLAINPNLTPDQIKNILVANGDTTVSTPFIGPRLNIYNALLAVNTIPTLTVTPTVISPTVTITITPTPTPTAIPTATPTPTLTNTPTPSPTPTISGTTWTENWDNIDEVGSRWDVSVQSCYSISQPGTLDMVCQSGGLTSKQTFDKTQPMELTGTVRAQPGVGSTTDHYWGGLTLYNNNSHDNNYGQLAVERLISPFDSTVWNPYGSLVVSLTNDQGNYLATNDSPWTWHTFKIRYEPNGTYNYYVDGSLKKTVAGASLTSNPDVLVLCVSVNSGQGNNGSSAHCQFGPINVTGVLFTPVPTSTSTPAPTATPEPIPADIDKNGCVGIEDFNTWVQAFLTQTVVIGTNPDTNRDGKINILDFNIWFQAMKLGQQLCTP